MKKKVVCDGCAFLMVVKGVEPFCLAGAYFVDSSLRRRVDVRGVKTTGKQNANGSCRKKERFSLKVTRIRRWLKKDCRRKGLTYLGKDLGQYRYATEVKKNERQRAGSGGSRGEATVDRDAFLNRDESLSVPKVD